MSTRGLSEGSTTLPVSCSARLNSACAWAGSPSFAAIHATLSRTRILAKSLPTASAERSVLVRDGSNPRGVSQLDSQLRPARPGASDPSRIHCRSCPQPRRPRQAPHALATGSPSSAAAVETLARTRALPRSLVTLSVAATMASSTARPCTASPRLAALWAMTPTTRALASSSSIPSAACSAPIRRPAPLLDVAELGGNLCEGGEGQRLRRRDRDPVRRIQRLIQQDARLATRRPACARFRPGCRARSLSVHPRRCCRRRPVHEQADLVPVPHHPASTAAAAPAASSLALPLSFPMLVGESHHPFEHSYASEADPIARRLGSVSQPAR